MGGVLILAGCLAAIIAIVCLIHPIRAIGIATRLRAVLVFFGGLILLILGGALLPKQDLRELSELAGQSATNPAPSPPSASTTSAQQVAPAQPTVAPEPQSAPKPAPPSSPATTTAQQVVPAQPATQPAPEPQQAPSPPTQGAQQPTSPTPPPDQAAQQTGQTPPPAAQQAAPTTSVNPVAPSTLREVQTALRQSGLYQGKIDGMWGPQTKRAVTAFQQQKNLPVTGTLDQQTLAAMKITSQ